MMKKTFFAVLFSLVAFGFVFAQNSESERKSESNNIKPWEEIVYRTFSDTIPDTTLNYTVEVRYSSARDSEQKSSAVTPQPTSRNLPRDLFSATATNS